MVCSESVPKAFREQALPLFIKANAQDHPALDAFIPNAARWGFDFIGTGFFQKLRKIGPIRKRGSFALGLNSDGLVIFGRRYAILRTELAIPGVERLDRIVVELEMFVVRAADLLPEGIRSRTATFRRPAIINSGCRCPQF
jgi:hypothetical protein